MRRVANSVFLLMSLLFFVSVQAQQTKTKTKTKSGAKVEKKTSAKTEIKEEVILPPPPPPPEEVNSDDRHFPVTAKINFDTTAAPEDSFTVLIRKLLLVTKTKDAEIRMAEKSFKLSLGENAEDRLANPVMQKFFEAFMFEMKEGRAARWLENLYIRNYRTLFTPDEIKTLIEFYQTPLGAKTLERTRILMENVMLEAGKIGAYLGPELMNKIISEEDKH